MYRFLLYRVFLLLSLDLGLKIVLIFNYVCVSKWEFVHVTEVSAEGNRSLQAGVSVVSHWMRVLETEYRYFGRTASTLNH